MSPKTVSTMVGLLAFGFMLAGCQSQPETSSSGTVSPTTAQEQSVSPVDGKSLTAKETYTSPAGPEEVGFTLVVDKDGVIKEAKTEVLGKAPTSKMRQESFAKDLPAAVVGKKLSDLTKVDRIGGSSLTTGAFNKALEELKKQV